VLATTVQVFVFIVFTSIDGGTVTMLLTSGRFSHTYPSSVLAASALHG
jgi:hypothetical protein